MPQSLLAAAISSVGLHMTLMSALGCCARLLSVSPVKEGYLIGNRSGALGELAPARWI